MGDTLTICVQFEEHFNEFEAEKSSIIMDNSNSNSPIETTLCYAAGAAAAAATVLCM